MKHARRPPLHPNCRSTLIPVVDLIDPETGEKIEETAERPAQNADGTYPQVAAKTTFKDYFESQPESFQREWLGEKRFELWKSGQLKFEDLAKPATTYRATPAAIRRVAMTGSAAKPKPAFDLPPLDLPELVLARLEGTPRQQSWAEDLRRCAVRDLTEERAAETARDALRRYRDKESAFAEEFRSDLEAAIKAVGGDEAAELILGVKFSSTRADTSRVSTAPATGLTFASPTKRRSLKRRNFTPPGTRKTSPRFCDATPPTRKPLKAP